MKLLVLSDTHRSLKNVDSIINKIGPKIDAIIHLGDMVDDQEYLKLKYPQYKFYCVSGNNDYSATAPDNLSITINGRNILLTHGHKQQVHWNYNSILYWAQEKDADLVLFGHTHDPICDNGGKVILFNPGSITLPRTTSYPTFGIVDIEESGKITCSIMLYLDAQNYKIFKTC